MNDLVEKIIIGTAQLGSDYGLAKRVKKIPSDEFRKIMQLGDKFNVKTLDTASSYGDSHTILSEIGIHDWTVISKIPALPRTDIDINNWFNHEIAKILKDLKVGKIHTLLIHNVNNLYSELGIVLWECLKRAKENGYMDKIGISIYSPDELSALDTKIIPDVVQTPFNLFDQRISTSGWLDRLNDKGIEVHARSIFLQGLLLQNSKELHPYFSKWAESFEKLQKFCTHNELSKLEAAVQFALNDNRLSKIVVGVENYVQFKSIIDAAIKVTNPAISADFSLNDVDLLNPLNWKAGY